MNIEVQNKIDEYSEKVDDYNTTLDVLKLFGHEMCCIPGSIEPKEGTICWCGRRMTTSANTEITPDIVVKLEKLFGIIAEVKNGLPRKKKYWLKSFNQISQYDDALKGWKEKDDTKVNHDLILLVPNKLRVEVEDYLTEKIENGEIEFERNFAAVSFHREDRAKTFYNFCKFFGTITDGKKDEELRKQTQVPTTSILPRYNYFFCDEKPPLPYTMANVWDQISNYIEIDDLVEKQDIIIQFETKQIICDIKAANSPVIINTSDKECLQEDDPRNPSYPKASWIRSALEELLKFDYLENHDANGTYSIPLKKYKRVKDPLEIFKKKIAQSKVKQKPSKSPKQMLLFSS